MEFETALKQELYILDEKREAVLNLFDKFGIPKNGHTTNGNSVHSKTDQYKHIIRDLIKKTKAFHITDFEAHFNSKGFEFNKGLIHQVLHSMRENKEVLAVRINKSNQRYFYMNMEAKQGEGIKDAYLPMDKKFIETIELMT